MSHIFDALLQSEADRNGKKDALPASLTEVLQRAELRTADEWKRRGSAGIASEGHHESEKIDESGFAVATEAAILDLEQAVSEPSDLVEEPYSPIDHVRRMPVMLPAGDRMIAYTEKESAAAEAFRLMAVRLSHIRKERQLSKLLITSTVPEEGKSMVSANLACTLAAVKARKVLLLEADVRHPSLTKLFQFSHHSGLCEWLKGDSSLEGSVYRLDDMGFWILPAGKPVGNALELIQSPRLSRILEELQTWFDWIIIDTPPVLPLADTSILAKLVDGIVLVTRRGVTQKKLMQRGIEALDKNKLLGAVINSSRKGHHGYYYYGYGSQASADGQSNPS